MYVSYTSTVGQYRTYPLGFTHKQYVSCVYVSCHADCARLYGARACAYVVVQIAKNITQPTYLVRTLPRFISWRRHGGSFCNIARLQLLYSSGPSQESKSARARGAVRCLWNMALPRGFGSEAES